MRILSVGHALFAATMIALGVMGLIERSFTPVWAPVPNGVPVRVLLIYACAVVSLGSGLGLLWKRTAASAARVLLGSLVLWLVVFRIPKIFTAPGVEDSWSGCGETSVIVAATWILYVWLATTWDDERLNVATGENGLRIARILFGLALLPFGAAHFIYAKETASLVPAWIPAHSIVAYLTGGAFIAAGVAVLSGARARLAAALATVQIGAFSLLVWVPIIAAGSKDAYQWSETVLSVAITAAAWVVADSYRTKPRFALRRLVR